MTTTLPKAMAPITRTAGGAPGELPITGPYGAPASLTADNVYPIPMVLRGITDGDQDSNELPETLPVWQLLYRITGTVTPEATNGTIILWYYSHWSSQWYAGPAIPLVGVSHLSTTVGSVIQIPGILGISHVGLQIVGLDPSNTMHLLHMAG